MVELHRLLRRKTGYKYRSFNQNNIDALLNNRVWASLAKDLNDPFEALVDPTDVDLFVQILTSISNKPEIKTHFENLLALRNKHGILSLSKKWDCELLWAHYGESHKGFCVEYDVEKLLVYFNKPFVRYTEVKYSQSIPQITLDILIGGDHDALLNAMNGFKSQSWEYESEIRVIYHEAGLQPHPPSAVSSVILGHRCKDSNRKVILDAAESMGFDVYQINLMSGSYSFSKELIFRPEKVISAKTIIDPNSTFYMCNCKSISKEYALEMLWASSKWLQEEDWIGTVMDIFIPSDFSKNERVVANIEKKNGNPIKLDQVSYSASELKVWANANAKDELFEVIKKVTKFH